MKDLGEADVILGMKLNKVDNRIAMSLAHSIKKMLQKFEYYYLNPISTPYDHNSHLIKNLEEPINQLGYSQE